MKTIAWNCRGMLSPTAVRELLELQGRIRAELIFLLDSHLNKIKADELCCKLGFDSMFLVESDGKAGCLVLFHQKENKIELNYLSSHFIYVMFMKEDSVGWRLTVFYGYPGWNDKHLSWADLRELHKRASHPWVVMGDFNEILYAHEKGGNERPPNSMMREFRNCLGECSLRRYGLYWRSIHLEER